MFPSTRIRQVAVQVHYTRVQLGKDLLMDSVLHSNISQATCNLVMQLLRAPTSAISKNYLSDLPPNLVRVGNRESLDGKVVVNMVHLDITSTARNISRLVSRLASVDALPADGPNEDLAMALDLLRREARGAATRARHSESLLNHRLELVLIASAVADGHHLHDRRVDGLARRVRLELDGVAPGLAVEDAAHLLHGLGVGIA